MPITRAYGQASQLGNTPAASNPVLNSAFQVWQRGTSFSFNNEAFYTADRWYGYSAGSGRTISRQTTGDTTNLPNIQYCARIQRTNGNTATNEMQFFQPFETVNAIPYAGKTVTLSFYARKGANYSPSVTDGLVAQVISGTGTDQNPINGYTGQVQAAGSTVTLTTTWQRFSITGAVAATATEFFIRFRVGGEAWTGTAGANDYYEVTGVQLDIGSVALPFRTYAATLAGELAACQRYYYRLTAAASYPGMPFGFGTAATTTLATPYVQFPVQMRVLPTSVDYSALDVSDVANAGINVTSTNISTNFGGVLGAVMDANVASGLTVYRPYVLKARNSTSYLGFSAEL